MRRTLIIAPHPDDEVLGCGGTILRKISEGESVAWLVVTSMSSDLYPESTIASRTREVGNVRRSLGISDSNFFQLGFPAAQLDQIPLSDIVGKIGQVLRDFVPHEIFLPNMFDVHSDHRIVAQAAISCSKWFRSPQLEKILAYETPSETDVSLGEGRGFNPNYFVDITGFLEVKIRTAEIYESEIGDHPFPRSGGTLRALAKYRGSQSGFSEAEAFSLLRQRI